MSKEPTNNHRRDIASKGMSRANARRSLALRRWLPAAWLLVVAGGCGTVETALQSTLVESTSEAVSTTVAVSTSVAVPTSDAVSTSIAVSTTVRSVVSTSTSVSTPVRPQPKITVSQTSGLDPKGGLVTVRGSGFDVTKGVYVFVCNQATWNAARRCVGGINLDGSSPLSQWISSNPPGYAIGLTVPFAADGTFVVPLFVRATDESTNLIDCTKQQCGIVTFADHTRRDDRSQDVFVPISFSNG